MTEEPTDEQEEKEEINARRMRRFLIAENYRNFRYHQEMLRRNRNDWKAYIE